MSQLFGRRVVLRVGDGEWRDLRVVFAVRRSVRKRPNLARGIRVYGLARDTIGAVMIKGAFVQLSAGYEDTAEVIFSGQLDRAQVIHEGADMCVEITARDGGAAWQRTVSRTFGGSSTIRSVVNALAVDMGLTVAPTAAITGSTRRSVVMRGYARDTLDIMLRSAGYEWSIQDGALQVVRVGAAVAGTAVVLSPETGLVSEPKALEKGRGWVVESLMQPKIRPGRVILLRSGTAEGYYRATIVEHEGDTHSPQPWTTRAELRVIS